MAAAAAAEQLTRDWSQASEEAEVEAEVEEVEGLHERAHDPASEVVVAEEEEAGLRDLQKEGEAAAAEEVVQQVESKKVEGGIPWRQRANLHRGARQ